MKQEYIILTMNSYHPWNTMESEQTETVVIPNDNFKQKNSQYLFGMFIREILDIDKLSAETSEQIFLYDITNDEVEIAIPTDKGEWIATIQAEYTDIKYYN